MTAPNVNTSSSVLKEHRPNAEEITTLSHRQGQAEEDVETPDEINTLDTHDMVMFNDVIIRKNSLETWP